MSKSRSLWCGNWTNPFDGNGRSSYKVSQTVFEDKVIQMISNNFIRSFCFRKSTEDQNGWGLWDKIEGYSESDSDLCTLNHKGSNIILHVTVINDILHSRTSIDAVIWSKFQTISSTKVASNFSLIVWNDTVWCFFVGVNKKFYVSYLINADKWSKIEEIKSPINTEFNPKKTFITVVEFRKQLVIMMARDDGIHITSTSDGKNYENWHSEPTLITKHKIEAIVFNDVLYQSIVSTDNFKVLIRCSSNPKSWGEWTDCKIRTNTDISFAILKNKLIQSIRSINDDVYLRYTEDGIFWTNWTICGDDQRKTKYPIFQITKKNFLYQTIISLDDFILTRKIGIEPSSSLVFRIDNTKASDIEKNRSYYDKLFEDSNFVQIRSIGNYLNDLITALANNTQLEYVDLSYSNLSSRDADDITNALKSHPKLKSLSLKMNQINCFVNGFKDLLNMSNTLTELDLSDNRLGDDGCKALLQCLSNLNKNKQILKKLNLSNNNIQRSGAQALRDYILKSTSLETVIFNHNNIQNEGCRYIVEGLSKNKVITYFELDCNGISMDGIKSIGDMLGVNTSLKSFILMNQNMKRIEGVKSLCNGIKLNKSLNYLNLSSNKIGSEGTSLIIESLSSNHSIITLDLSNNDVEDEGLLSLAKSIKDNPTIQRLLLNSNDFRRIGTTAIANAIVYSNIKVLNISQCALSHGGIKALCEAIRITKSLEEIYMNECRLGDPDAEEISNALIVNKTIRHIELNNNHFETEGLRHFSEFIKQNNTLKHFSVLGSPIIGLIAKGFANALSVNNTLETLKINIGCMSTGICELKEIMDSLIHKTNIKHLHFKLKLGKLRIKPILNFISSNKHIKSLSITHSELTDIDIIEFAEVLKENTSIEKLDFSSNKIGSPGVAAIANALLKNKSLFYLNLNENMIGYDCLCIFEDILKENKVLRQLILDEKYSNQLDISYVKESIN